MNKKNLIKWSFWPVLAAILFAGYFFINKTPENKHLDFIPSNAKAVVVLDSKFLAGDYYELLRYNPTKIDEVMPPGETDEELVLPTELPGIVPLEKMVFYFFQDKGSKNQQFFKCFIATISDKSQFLKKMNGMRENAIIKDIDNGKVYHFKEDNKIVLLKNDVGVVIEPINPGFKLKTEIGERHFVDVFGNKENSLINTSNSFSSTLKEKNHMNIWSASGEGVLEGFGGNMVGIDKIFNSHIISVNLNEENIGTDVHLFLNDKDYIVENGNDKVKLSEHEMLKLSMSLNATKFNDYFHNLLPEDKYFLADGWTGNICTSIIGFRTDPVYQTISDTTLNEITNDTLFTTDTIELSRLVNLPHFVLSIEINNHNEIENLLESDTTILSMNDYKYMDIPNLINEKVYIKLNGNNLLLSSTPLDFDYAPSYTTFAFKMDIEQLIYNYPPKDMIQALIIPTISKFELKSFEMSYSEMNDEFVCLNGNLRLGKDKIHSLLKVVPLAFNMAAEL